MPVPDAGASHGRRAGRAEILDVDLRACPRVTSAPMATCTHPDANAARLFAARDYVTGDAFEIWRCDACGLARTVPQPDAASAADVLPGRLLRDALRAPVPLHRGGAAAPPVRASRPRGRATGGRSGTRARHRLRPRVPPGRVPPAGLGGARDRARRAVLGPRARGARHRRPPRPRRRVRLARRPLRRGDACGTSSSTCPSPRARSRRRDGSCAPGASSSSARPTSRARRRGSRARGGSTSTYRDTSRTPRPTGCAVPSRTRASRSARRPSSRRSTTPSASSSPRRTGWASGTTRSTTCSAAAPPRCSPEAAPESLQSAAAVVLAVPLGVVALVATTALGATGHGSSVTMLAIRQP